MKPWLGFLSAFWAALVTGPALRAADPAELTALRQSYQMLLAEAEASARARWLAALEAQERLKAAGGDFSGAALIRERRLALTTGKPVTGAGRAPVILSTQTARSTTAVDFADTKKEVARFRRTGAMMEWEIPGPAPGGYEVNLVFGVMGAGDRNDLPDPYKDPAVALPLREASSNALIPERAAMTAGGVVEFRKITSLREGGALLRCSVRSTGGWATERTLTMGRIDLDGKSVKFSLRAVDALPAGAMDFRRLELVPATVSPAAGGGPAEAGNLKELSRLKEVYQKQFAELSRGPAARYLKGLGELEVVAAKKRDNETLALVRQEKQRLIRPESQVSAGADDRRVRVLPVTEKLYMLASGEARLTNQGDFLTKLRPANGCEITWKLAGLGVPSGTYTVEVDCRLTPEHGGSAVLVATTPGGNPGPVMPLTIDPAVFDPSAITAKRKPDGSPGTSTLRQFTAGQVTIPKGSEYLKLQVTSLAVPDGALCDLKLLRLTPLQTESP